VGRLLLTLQGNATSICFTPDGRYILSGNWSNLSIGEDDILIAWEEPLPWKETAPDRASRFESTLRLWEIASGQEVRRFVGHTGRITSVYVTPDCHYALSGSKDQTLRLWEFDWEWEF